MISYPGPRPRNVTATDREINLLLNHAPRYLLLWLLLCSDLAIRSGTAATIGPEHYDPATQTLQFTTKYGAPLTMPVTAEIAALLESLNHNGGGPYCYQLRCQEPKAKGGQPSIHTKVPVVAYSHTFVALRRKLGITRKLTPHDFRRTAAVKMYKHTGDARAVQSFLGHRSLASTIWYLDHDLQAIPRDTLELIKSNRTTQPTQKKTA